MKSVFQALPLFPSQRMGLQQCSGQACSGEHDDHDFDDDDHDFNDYDEVDHDIYYDFYHGLATVLRTSLLW